MLNFSYLQATPLNSGIKIVQGWRDVENRDSVECEADVENRGTGETNKAYACWAVDTHTALYRKTFFKVPNQPTKRYVDLWGDYGELDHKGSYTLSCATFMDMGNPDRLSDLHFELKQCHIFAKIG